MCLIVFKEKEDAYFTNRQFKSMIARNADGLGIMWREDGRVKVEKSLGSPKEKFRLFQKHRNKPAFAMHARFKTHGNIDLNNCHPYELLNIDKGDPIDLYLMHNGVLSDAPNVNPSMSDTWHFVEYILKPIAKANLDLLWNGSEFQTWLSSKIKGSKLLLMRSDELPDNESVLIFNYEAGKVETGCWLSNAYSTGYQTNNNGNYNYNHHNNYRGNASTNDPFQQNRLNDRKKIPQLPMLTTSAETGIITGKTPLISQTSDTKIIDFSNFRTIENQFSIQPTNDLYQMAVTLKYLPHYQIREFVRDEADDAADIILAFYEKNTMPYDTIIRLIRDPNTIDGIVNIIKHVSQTIESIVKTRNVN